MESMLISPLCDLDHGSMSPKELILVHSGENHSLSAYVCDTENCNRWYNEAAGYFDFSAGKPQLQAKQKLCVIDAHAMFLEFISIEGDEIWRAAPTAGTRMVVQKVS